jgi:hypothetical protein
MIHEPICVKALHSAEDTGDTGGESCLLRDERIHKAIIMVHGYAPALQKRLDLHRMSPLRARDTGASALWTARAATLFWK